MTDIAKEIFEEYEVRKSRKQRTAFIEYVKDFAHNHGYEANVEKGSLCSRNIVVGDVDNAKVIYTAHYDTCARMFFPNFMTPKNIFLYIVYQLLIVAGFFVTSAVLTFPFAYLLSFADIEEDLIFNFSYDIWLLIYFLLLFLMMFGPANKHTANDNTSGVTTLLDIMTNLPEDLKDKVAFVFFDLEEAGLIGSSSFASKHKNIKKSSLVLNFDCVSDGETMLFALKRTTRKYADILDKAFVSTPDVTVDIAKSAFYPSDNAVFEGGIGVSALKKSKLFGVLYMDRIHTKKDVIYREQNIEFLKNGAIRLAQML